jgi:hypothetical protein
LVRHRQHHVPQARVREPLGARRDNNTHQSIYCNNKSGHTLL